MHRRPKREWQVRSWRAASSGTFYFAGPELSIWLRQPGPNSVPSGVRVDNERKSATRGSRADEGVRPTLASRSLSRIGWLFRRFRFGRSAGRNLGDLGIG